MIQKDPIFKPISCDILSHMPLMTLDLISTSTVRKDFVYKLVAVAEWVARQTAEQEVGSSNPSIPPLLKHTCGEGDWLLCWHYTPAKGVVPEVNLRERILRMPPPSVNKAEPTLALKPRGDITRSPKQGYQWPHKWACVQQKFKKKKRLCL